jgi:3-dehydroquinate dehydratase-2
MGSGKTTVGEGLAEYLGWQLIDTDQWIEENEQQSVAEIFATKGEEYFRQQEHLCLQKLVAKAKSGLVIATGGGMPTRAENRALLKELGTVVYLKAPAEVIYERVKHFSTRPLLRTPDPQATIAAMLAEREPHYEEVADFIIEVAEKPVNKVISEITERKNVKNMKILVINGANLNFLGIRETDVYGTEDYQHLLGLIGRKGQETDSQIEVFQSNHEGAIIDRIQDAYSDGTEGLIINPGAYAHYSYAIRDALAILHLRKVEVHISNIKEREIFRATTVTAEACHHLIYGQGLDGYMQAIDYILTAK